MDSPLVIRRIEAWEATGLIDAATAERLRKAEATATATATASVPGSGAVEPAQATAGRAPGVTAVELFVYLGAAFVLGAWYALIGSTVQYGEDTSAMFGVAGLIAALALGLTGVVLARRDARFRRAAGFAFLAALPNLGAGIFLVAGTVHAETYGDAPTNALVATVVVLLAAVAARQFLPALATQLGLALSSAAAGLAGMLWFGATLFPRGAVDYEPPALSATAATARVALAMAWWWVVALAMALLLVVLDPEPRTPGRTRLGRIAAGTAAILGTAWAVIMRHDWNAAPGLADEPVLEPFLGAAILLAVSGLLLWLSVRRSSIGYLWPGGLGVFIALTWLNAEYLAVESGLWIALLVEAVVLFGVAFGVNRMGRRLRPAQVGTVVG